MASGHRRRSRAGIDDQNDAGGDNDNDDDDGGGEPFLCW